MEPHISPETLTELLVTNAQKVLGIMLGEHPEPRTIALSRDRDVLQDGIISFIGLVGNWTGTGSVLCSSTTAEAITSQLLLANVPAIDQEVLDSMGELTNMIFGNLKDSLEPVLGPLSLSTPSVIWGRHVRARDLRSSLCSAAAVEYRGHLIELKISLSPARNFTSGLRPGVLMSNRPGVSPGVR